MDHIVESLHPLERKVQPFLNSCTNVNELSEKTGLQEVETVRALQWLENKGFLKIDKKITEYVIFGPNGKDYADNGLPEKRFIWSLSKKDKCTKEELQSSANLSNEEFSVSLGLMKKKGAVEIKKEHNNLIISITKLGKELQKKESPEEQFLKKIKKESLDLAKLEDQDKSSFDELNKRRSIVDTRKETIFYFSLTDEGKKLASLEINEEDILDNLTPQSLKDGSWRNKKLRRYDVEINVPLISGGKRHIVKQALDYGREVWKNLGFSEMEGPLLETSFWNFDALFTAQDHPVREMQDTYFIKNPNLGTLPAENLVKEVKSSHENGGKSGSQGWKYEWNEEVSKENVLRTHTTNLSVRTLSKLKKGDVPAKFFAVGRVFRNETVDWSHLFEFNQSEGIVVDRDVNFRHLLGFLKQFFISMGYPKARFRPAHFPYTEPSVEIDVFDEKHGEWLELGGAGIFRPEVVVPLMGEDIPVLAWGPGIDRLIPKYFKIEDLRDLYRNDIKQLQEKKLWLK